MITNHWTASDGVELAWREMGQGRAVILLHGLFSDAQMNWIKFRHAERIASAGFRVIMPDLRAHGLSAKPHDPAHYGRGVLARDVRELIAHLALTDYDLGGFSLGARTTVQVIGEGARPRRAILAGMGLQGLTDWNRRQAFFHEAIAQFDVAKRGDKWWMAIQFMKTMKVDRVAAGHLLRTFEDAQPGWLQAFTMPTLILCGDKDDDNGSASALAEALPTAELEYVPGTHMSSVVEPAFGEAIARFLSA
ncbi:alpha/beta fold hydrolase [Sphingomonas arenae]|uniref:alpha/beta fold hydrolase n=1 Tax=Sphingomonas arenae TaxID=2812555 RepID=UPI0019678338|nr:alpha/beta fold hydrolase [Sphingomonas arenae]